MIGTRHKDLAATVGRLEERIKELEHELRRRPAALPVTPPGWDVGDPAAGGAAGRSVSHAWLSILEPPIRRRPRLPRLPFEVLFLAGCAVAAGVADLEPLWIAAVMGAAWLCVSLTEWSATMADRRRGESTTMVPPTRVEAAPSGADQAWYLPPVE